MIPLRIAFVIPSFVGGAERVMPALSGGSNCSGAASGINLLDCDGPLHRRSPNPGAGRIHYRFQPFGLHLRAAADRRHLDDWRENPRLVDVSIMDEVAICNRTQGEQAASPRVRSAMHEAERDESTLSFCSNTQKQISIFCTLVQGSVLPHCDCRV